MPSPYVTIDLEKIARNARAIVELCRAHGMAVTGVTKGTAGHPEVAQAMIRGGVTSIGESQLDNIQRLTQAGVRMPYLLLRLPSLAEVDDVVRMVDISLNSEFAVLAGLSRAALRHQRVHQVMVMVDLGDLREGLWPHEVVPFINQAVSLPGIHIVGLGTNLACFGGVMPSAEHMTRLVEIATDMERACGLALEWISGVNSSGLTLLAAGSMPTRINHARIGEAILLGRETTHRQPWPGTAQDAFVLHADILELKWKPSVPVGERGENAFGQRTSFANHGLTARALVNIGREEVPVEGLTPCDQRLTILGASSSYLVVDMTAATACYHVGDELTFTLTYGALLSVMTSAYVQKRSLRNDPPLITAPTET
jgi:ornithine racemase